VILNRLREEQARVVLARVRCWRGRARGLGPRFGGGAAQDEELPQAEEDSERNGHREEGQAVATEGIVILIHGPKDRCTADTECGDNAEDTPRDAGFARAVGAKHDTDADADHGEIPNEWKEEAEGVRTGSQPHQGDGADGHEQCASGERADGEFFHRGRRAQGR